MGKFALQEQPAAEGRVVLTSTSAVDYAFEEKESDLSVYTRYLVEGIEKGTADLNGDGFITVDELHKFASRKVKETAPAMTPDMITLQGQGHDIRLARTPQDRPELRYRKEFEKRSRKGTVTKVGRRILKSLQREYQLSDDAIALIEAEVLKPHRDYQAKQAEYRETLADCLADGPELDRDHLIDLKDYQKRLGLKDEDVQAIELELMGRALSIEAEPNENTQESRQSIERTDTPYAVFSFETVRVDERGSVIETIPAKAEYFTEELANGVTLEMVRIPGGKFLMGAAAGEKEARPTELPQHEVTVPEFWMGEYAVTQEQWRAIAALNLIERELNPDPARFKGAKRPVEQISWQEAVEFCQRLSQYSGREYSLPSEAQWEYACRAGTTTPFSFGSTIAPDLVNYAGNQIYGKGPKGEYRRQTTEAGAFSPNAFGLYDMHGNLSEWCLDNWHDSYKGAPTDGSASAEGRSLRGGSWNFIPRNCRSAFRGYYTPDIRLINVGFRVSCSAPRT